MTSARFQKYAPHGPMLTSEAALIIGYVDEPIPAFECRVCGWHRAYPSLLVKGRSESGAAVAQRLMKLRDTSTPDRCAWCVERQNGL